MLKAIVAFMPISIVISLAGVEAMEMIPVAREVRTALSEMGECANQRMMQAAAVADGVDDASAFPSSAGDPWVVPMRGVRSIASVSYAPITYCGRRVDGTVVTFDDGGTARFPGRGTLVALRDGSAEFQV